jgi:hypothetical protein
MNEMTPEQERFAKALLSFPQKLPAPSQQEKEWAKYYNLYEALRKLGDLLGDHGRFMYNPISALRKGEFYLLGIQPGDATKKEKNEGRDTSLRIDIHKWSKQSAHVVINEDWNTDYQDTVKALCREVGIDLYGLCVSNLYFYRKDKNKNLPYVTKNDASVFWHVHEAVLDIVKPDCIFFFFCGKDAYLKILILMRANKSSPFSPTEGNFGNEKCKYKTAKGEYQGRPLTLIGMPCPNAIVNRQPLLEDDQEVLEQMRQIVKECRTADMSKPSAKHHQ